MNTFPLLNTGAVTQYPAKSATIFSNQIVQFVGGGEQRFPAYASSVHHWTVQLDLLDEDEISRLTDFFADLSGAAGSFGFTDPAREQLIRTAPLRTMI